MQAKALLRLPGSVILCPLIGEQKHVGSRRRFMNFELSDEQRAIEATARKFASERLAPHAAKWDADEHFPVDVLRQAAGLGFAGIYVRTDVGGSELSRLD